MITIAVGALVVPFGLPSFRIRQVFGLPRQGLRLGRRLGRRVGCRMRTAFGAWAVNEAGFQVLDVSRLGGVLARYWSARCLEATLKSPEGSFCKYTRGRHHGALHKW